MKKIVSLILAFLLCISLCACKSDEVKNVEAQINTLNANSTYKEIDSVNSLYSALSSKDREKVENVDVLRDYCEPGRGCFVLNDEMLQEIEGKFESIYAGVSGVDINLIQELSVKSAVNGWSDYGNIEVTSHKQEDAYTYSVYGTFVSVDEFGDYTSRKFIMWYRAFYREETANGYEIEHDLVLR